MVLLGILFKINISLLIFYGVYRYVLRSLTFYNFNRVYLLSAIMISGLLPFLQFAPSIHQRIGRWQEFAGIHPIALIQSFSEHSNWTFVNVVHVVYWSGVAVMTGLFLIQLLSLLKLYFGSESRYAFGHKIRKPQEETPPFSFFKTIFIHPQSHTSEDLLSILKHESVHTKQWHSIDVIIGEVKRIFCWFNPVAWLMLAAIRENLEFIADRKVLSTGTNPKDYQYALLAVQQQNTQKKFANNFNLSHLKIRITMMNKKKTADFHLLKYLLTVPVIAFASLLTNYVNAQNVLDQKLKTSQIVINGKAFDAKELVNLKEEELEEKIGMKKGDIKTVEIRNVKSLTEGEITNLAIDKYNNMHAKEYQETIGDKKEISEITVTSFDEQLSNIPIEVKNKLINHINKISNNEDVSGIVIKSKNGIKINNSGNIAILDNPFSLNINADKTLETYSPNSDIKPLYFVDGERVEEINNIHPQDISRIYVLKGVEATAQYPSLKEGQGVIKIETKDKSVKTTQTQKIANSKPALILFPNPTDGVLNVDINNKKIGEEYEILDLQGNRIQHGKLKNKNVLDTSKFKPGTYIIKMEVDGKQEIMKFQVGK